MLPKDIGNTPHTIEDFTFVIMTDSSDVDAIYNRGAAYSRMGDFIKSIPDFTAAIAIEADSTAARYFWCRTE
ncbi:MAG: tetratricopeptide repeat protein [Candidatus Aegiribacteria sp.]|nr:tetratricopeptide repeat protein [Candidatus Aegiribacteria sp.]